MIHSNNSAYLKFYDSELNRYHNAFYDSSKMLFDIANMSGFFAEFEFIEDIADIDFILKHENGSEIDFKALTSIDQFDKTQNNYPCYLGTSKINASITAGCYYIVIRSASNEVYSDQFMVDGIDFDFDKYALIVYDKEESLNNSIIFDVELKATPDTSITVDWDDGSSETFTVTSSGHTFSKTFTSNRIYNIKIAGNLENVTSADFDHSASIHPSGGGSGYVSNVEYRNMEYLSNITYLSIDTKTDTFTFSDTPKLETVVLNGVNYPFFDNLNGLENSRNTLTSFLSANNKMFNVFKNKEYLGLQQCNNLQYLSILDTDISSIFYQTTDRKTFDSLIDVDFSGCKFASMPLIGFELSGFSVDNGFANLDEYVISDNFLKNVYATSFGIPQEFFVNGTLYNFKNNELFKFSVDIILDYVADFNKYITNPANTTDVTVDISGGNINGANATPTMNVRFIEIIDGGDFFNVGDTIVAGTGDIVYTVDAVVGTGEISEISITSDGENYPNLVSNIVSTSGAGTGATIHSWSSKYHIEDRNGTVNYNS